MDMLILFTTAALVYGQVAGFEFLTNWDDPEYITNNHLLRSLSWQSVAASFTSTLMGNYAPIQNLSYMIDVLLGGGQLKPVIFHISNLVWHLANTLLLYWFALRITGSRIWAVAASLVFLLHPVQVESVAWLAERKNIVSMFFFILTLLAYDAYRKNSDNRRWLFYTASVICTLLALCAKVSVVVIPLILIVYDYCFLTKEQRPSWKKSVAEKIPFALLAALLAYQATILQLKELGGGRAGYHGGSLYTTMLTMVHVLADYIRLIIWPTGQSAIYTPEIILVPDAITIGLLLLYIGIVIAGVKLYQRQSVMFFGLSLFFIGLLPVSQLIPLVTLMHDRYLYIPMLGIGWLAGGSVHLLWQRYPAKRRPVAVSVILVAVVIGLISYERTKVWRNSITLWTDTTKKLPNNWGVWDALAEAYISAGDNEGAARAYDKVFSMKPDFMNEDSKEIKALNNAGAIFMERGDFERSRSLLETLTTKYPEYSPGFINLGFNAKLQGDSANAEKAYRRALEIDPDNTSALMAMGTLFREKGNLAGARDYYMKSFKNRGDGSELRYALACLEARSGNINKALDHLEVAVLKGFNDYKALSSNHELDPLRSNSRFQNLLRAVIPPASR